jgi:kinetochore protein Spc7/SPC105
MRYKREIELVFDVRSLRQQQQQRQHQQQQRNTSIDLRYVAETTAASRCSPEKEFFLRHIREHVRAHAKSATRPSRLLRMVSSAWDKAEAVTEHIRRLNLSFPSSVAFSPEDGDAVVRVTASVLLVPLQTRLEVILNLSAKDGGDDDGLEVVVTPEARVVYGEPFNTAKTRELLAGRIGGSVVSGKDGETKKMGWDEAVLESYGRLLAKGKQRQS